MTEHAPTKQSDDMNDNRTPENKTSLFFTSDTPPENNSAWGDNIIPKKSDTLRLYFQNINGVQSNTNWNKWRDIVTGMTNNQVDIMGLVETNINWNLNRNKRALTLLRT